MHWYYADGGRQAGPLDEAAFRDLVGSGKIRAETLVWRAGMPTWQPYGTIEPTPLPTSVASARFCAQCGASFPPDELVAFGPTLVCVNCKPIFAQSLLEGAPLAGVRYAGFWIRCAAVLLDAILLNIVFLIISTIWTGGAAIDRTDPVKLLAAEGWMLLVELLIGVAYDVFFVGRFGATPGKMTCRLKIITAEGGRVSYARALGRYFAKTVSALTLFIGYIMAGFDEEKRALHDRICNTRVIRQ